MVYSPPPMDGGESNKVYEDLEERLARLERLAEELEGAPDAGVVEALGRAVALLDEVNAGIRAGLDEAEGEAQELGDLLDRMDFGPFDTALQDLEDADGR